MGESAGAGSIMHHITSFGGSGTVPFAAAIPQSPAFQPFVPSQSEALFSIVLANASTLAKTTISTAEELRALPYETLFQLNQIVVGEAQYGSYNFGPVVDPSPNSYVPDLPSRLITQGKYHRVSVLAGHNSDEGLVFTPPFIQTQPEYTTVLETLFPSANASTISLITDTLYPPVYSGVNGYKSAIERTALTISNFIVTCNVEALASNLSPAYAYEFSIFPGLHGEDVPYTFFNGDTSTIDDAFAVNATVATAFQRYLVEFVMNGKPTSQGYEAFVTYGSNDTITNIAASGLGTQSKDPGASSQCAFWNQASYYVANSTSTSTSGGSPSSTSSTASPTTSKKSAGIAMRVGNKWAVVIIGVMIWTV
jgi:carboxylesterase type B